MIVSKYLVDMLFLPGFVEWSYVVGVLWVLAVQFYDYLSGVL